MKIEMSPKKVKVEIPDYGEFEVSPLGAGAEAEINLCFRELEEAINETKEYQALIDREKAGEDIKGDKQYPEALEKFKEVTKKSDMLRDKVVEKMSRVFQGDKAEKVLNDFSYDQILEIYRKATKEDD